MSLTALITMYVEKSVFKQENFAIYEHRGTTCALLFGYNL
jgi:hypothetical protein